MGGVAMWFGDLLHPVPSAGGAREPTRDLSGSRTPHRHIRARLCNPQKSSTKSLKTHAVLALGDRRSTDRVTIVAVHAFFLEDLGYEVTTPVLPADSRSGAAASVSKCCQGNLSAMTAP